MRLQQLSPKLSTIKTVVCAVFIFQTALLTHICRVDYSILIYYTSPFVIFGMSGLLFHLHSISNRYSCYQTVKNLIRRRVLWRPILICTFCTCPQNGTLGLYDRTQQNSNSNENFNLFFFFFWSIFTCIESLDLQQLLQ